MADDLSAPLGRKPARRRPLAALATGKLPLGRIALGLAALIVAGLVARVVLVHDPNGGRPVTEISVNSPKNANTLAQSLTAVTPDASMAAISVGPEMPVGGAQVTEVGSDVPDGTPDAAPPGANADGLFADLLEETGQGSIPRISATGETPFVAYARPSLTPATADGKKLIALVVTGLGLNPTSTSAAIQTLPDAVTLAFAPYGKGLSRTVGDARAQGHEVLLEVPLEPFDYPDSDPGPDTLLTGQAPRDNLDKLFKVMGRFGGYVGVINHMGARFTASTSDFNPVMEELGARGLAYLDDGSSNRSVAQQLATANKVPFGRASMVLDNTPARGPILDALKTLEERATGAGTAIGLVSALPVSIETLAEWTKTAADRGFIVVPVSALMQAGS
ncbi:MAG: divergent polysaccharide deacetylase family protein [Devosia sp.]